MRAVLRLGFVIAAAGLGLGQAPAFAQSAPAATTNTPAPDSIGPRELQNFNLQGTVTRPAETSGDSRTAPPAARAPAPERSTAARTESTSRRASPQPARSVQSAAERPGAGARTAAIQPAPQAQTRRQAPRSSSITVELPAVGSSTSSPAADPIPAAAPGFSDESETAGSLAPEQGLSLWPWLLAAVALGAGAAFLLWRRNAREAFAGGPRIEALLAPDPVPPVRVPEPAPKAAPLKPVGVVSTRLRPWVDISFEPLRCIVEEAQVRFEFEIALFNSGSGPARDLLIEARLFNASATQDREIGDFFGQPVGQGDRISSLGPLKRMDLRPQLVIPRDQLRVLEAGGRKLFVPLIAFNAIYRWGGGGGQTSAAYLLGRDTKSEKLAPFRLDLGPRIFRGLGARVLPVAVRQ